MSPEGTVHGCVWTFDNVHVTVFSTGEEGLLFIPGEEGVASSSRSS